jgi:branched-chain amino acid transport system ATP-binding protein
MPASVLSGGEQQMLAISRALLARPKLMMLDEPSLGLSPILVRQLFDLIRDLNRDGLAIMLVEQNTRMALATARRGYVLELGAIVLKGNAKELSSDTRLEDAYLGGKSDRVNL